MLRQFNNEFETYYAALLQGSIPTQGHIQVLLHIASSNPVMYREIWAAISSRLVQVEVLSLECQALWCVLDSILKAIPLLYVPLVSVKLLDYVEHYMPWDAYELAWRDNMIAHWQQFFPPAIGANLKRRTQQLKSGAELRRQVVGEGSESQKLASEQQRQQLASSWDELWSALKFLPKGDEEGSSANITIKKEPEVKVKIEGQVMKRDLPPDVESDSDVEEYVPNYIAGAEMTKLKDDDVEIIELGKAAKKVQQQQGKAAQPPPPKREMRKRPGR